MFLIRFPPDPASAARDLHVLSFVSRLLRVWFPGLAMLALGGCSSPTIPVSDPASAEPVRAVVADPVPALAEEIIARMTLEQKVGQTMIIGFDGVAYDTALRRMVEQHHVGGVILFARNIESPAQTARLTNAVQAGARSANGIGLFAAIDQEGGRVARLTEAKGFSEFPGAMALGASGGEPAAASALARQVGTAMAAELRAVGLNVNFAPDLDVNNNPANPVIGIRSFGSEPSRVAALGAAYVEGLQRGGVLAFGKHFPGHGDTAVDSHAALPVVPHGRPRLEAVEFVPFRAAIAGGIAGIMSAHVAFPTIDPTPQIPATLSEKVLVGVLRRDLRFDGLVITDSLEMGALADHGFPVPRAAARALAAGADLLLFNNGHAAQEAAIAQIVADVRQGVIPPARLDDAVRRVLRAKLRFGVMNPAAVDPAKAAAATAAPAHRSLAAQVARQSITLLRDERGVLPLSRAQPPVVVALPGATGLASALGGTEVRVRERATPGEILAATNAVRAHSGATVVVTLAGANANAEQGELLRQLLSTGAAMVVVAIREPYDVAVVPLGRRNVALLATYGLNPPTLAALVAVLRGEARPAGRLPVEIPGRFPLGTGQNDFTRRPAAAIPSASAVRAPAR